MNDQTFDRDAWLKSLKPGDTVMRGENYGYCMRLFDGLASVDVPYPYPLARTHGSHLISSLRPAAPTDVFVLNLAYLYKVASDMRHVATVKRSADPEHNSEEVILAYERIVELIEELQVEAKQ